MGDESINDPIRRLASGKCVPCKRTRPFSTEEANRRLEDLPGWSLESGAIQKEFRFMTYIAGLDFACALGKVADLEDHHPDMLVGWRRVRISLSTHAIKGLSQNDFIIAAKSELEYAKLTERAK